MGRRGWSTIPVPEGWVQVVRGPRPKSVQWPRAPKHGKPQQQRQPRATQQCRWRLAAPQWSSGTATGTKDRDPGATPPRRRWPWPHERVSKLEAALRAVGGRRRHSSEPPRGVEESPPASSASVNADKVAQCESFLERARKREAAARELLLSSPDRVDTVECRGRRRGATVGDTSSRVGALPVSSCCSRHVRRGAEVACSGGTVVEGEGRCPSPNRPESQAGVSPGRFHSHSAKRRCKSGSKADRGICKRLSWPAISQKWRGYPNSCPQQHRSGNGSSKNSLQRCHLQWRIW